MFGGRKNQIDIWTFYDIFIWIHYREGELSCRDSDLAAVLLLMLHSDIISASGKYFCRWNFKQRAKTSAKSQNIFINVWVGNIPVKYWTIAYLKFSVTSVQVQGMTHPLGMRLSCENFTGGRHLEHWNRKTNINSRERGWEAIAHFGEGRN